MTINSNSNRNTLETKKENKKITGDQGKINLGKKPTMPILQVTN